MTDPFIAAAANAMAEATNWFVQPEYAIEGLEALVAQGWILLPPNPGEPVLPDVRGGTCIRCRQTFDPLSVERCPNAPDGLFHEAPRFPEVRQGSSLHVRGCPRSDPSPELPSAVVCTCRRAHETTGAP